MKTIDFTKHINKLRLNNKSSWYSYSGIVDGKNVSLKAYGTWLQIYKVNGVDYSNCMDVSVKKFKEDLQKPFN